MPLRHSQRDEPVRRVIATTLRRRAAGELPQHSDESGVEDGNEENEDRDSQHRQKASRSAAADVDKRRAREEEAHEHRTAVAHEDRRRIRVVDQKSKQAAGEDQKYQRFGVLAAVHKTERDKPSRDYGDA